MHIVSSLVGIDSLQVHNVSDNVVLVRYPVSAEHVSGLPGDVERLAAVVSLHEGDHLGGELVRFYEPPHAKRGLQPESDLGVHVGELLLD